MSLLGAPEVASPDGARVFALPRRTLDVLAYLLLNRGRTLPRAAVAFALFPDEEEVVARNSLRRNLSYLLSALPPVPKTSSFIFADVRSITWNLSAPAVFDVDEFERAKTEGRVDDALRLYRGDLLPTLYADWTMAERERLRSEYHELLLRKIHDERSLRRYDAASAIARLLLDQDPWREDVLRLLMALRHEAGDRSGALAEFEGFSARLKSEMQTDPMAETRRVRDAVMRGDILPTSERDGGRLATAAVEPSFGLPFIGREAAMTIALARWHLAADGNSGIIFVAGEAGIGKSRFVTELARAIEFEGGVVARGQTTPPGERHPYEAFVDALQHARPGSDQPLLGEHAGAVLTDDRSARVRFFETVRGTVAELARARPFALILEDLHWAGGDTVALLDFVALRLAAAPVLLVVTMRTDELLRAHPLRVLSRQLENRGSADVLTLKRLSAEESREAIRVSVPVAPGEELVADAVDWADGVPLLLAEAARDIAAGRTVAHTDIAGLVGDRFARLTPRATTALAYSAAIGSRFELATLAAAVGWSDAAVIDALSESVELGLVRVGESSRGIGFAFTHHVLHAASYELVDPRQRITAHAMIARVLQASPESDGPSAAEVARHFERAGEVERAARYWSQAARYALSIFANEDARSAASAGLALAGDDAGLRYELLATREDALRRVGGSAQRRADASAMLECAADNAGRRSEALLRMFDAYRDDPDVRRSALARLAELSSASDRYAAIYDRVLSEEMALNNDFAAARDAALRAATRFAEIGEEREAVEARLYHLRMLQKLGDVESAASAISELRPAMERTTDISAAAQFYDLAASEVMHDRYEDALSDARFSFDLALRMGDRYAEASARMRIATLSGRLRNYADLEAQLQAALVAFRDVGDSGGIGNALLNIAAWQEWFGDFAAARQTLLELHDAPSRENVLATHTRGLADLWEGHLEIAERELESVRDRATELGRLRYVALAETWLAQLYRLNGEPERSRRTIDAALAKMFAFKEPDLRAEAGAFSARLYAEAGDVDRALTGAHATEALAGSVPILGYSSVAWHLARAYACLGDGAAAMRCAVDAARAFIDDALRMSASSAESYARLPWHREIISYLWEAFFRNASGTPFS